MKYIPQIDDYVKWNSEHTNLEGWVYFCDEQYITIETGVKPKPNCEYTTEERHKYIHTLVLCFPNQWKDLKYVYTRKNKYGKNLEDMDVFVREI